MFWGENIMLEAYSEISVKMFWKLEKVHSKHLKQLHYFFFTFLLMMYLYVGMWTCASNC